MDEQRKIGLKESRCGWPRSRSGRMHGRLLWVRLATAIVGAAIVSVGSLAAQQPGAAELVDSAATSGRRVTSALEPPPMFSNAILRGWRSEDGSPGPGYWQQWSRYEIEARLDPATGSVEGSVEIRYVNNASATLNTVWLHLYQNLHQEDAPRSDPDEEVTGGVTLTRVVADGQELEVGDLEVGAAYQVEGTLMELRPPEPLVTGDTLVMEIDWDVTLPQSGAGRMGHSDREVYLVAYWYPRMAVFEPLRGWDAQRYLGQAEFYDGFGDYRVELSVPSGWTVMATGRLQNPDEVYTALTRTRLDEADRSDEVVRVAGTAERAAGTVTVEPESGWLSYRFEADSVRDFTWTTSNVQTWDAASATVPDRDGDGTEDRVAIHSFWREDRAPLWAEQWRYAKQAIEFHSRYTELPYPGSHMTSVEGEGIIEGGMEFPMLTLVGAYTGQGAQELFNVTSHEVAHMWVPMIVGTNEKRHAWMDEGSATFLEAASRMEYWPGVDHFRVEARYYLQAAEAGVEQSMMIHGDEYDEGPAYSVASYVKPAALFAALGQVLGEDRWLEAYRTFFSEWAYKHPTPWDFFNTVERFAERDLDWFWTSYFYETWTMDQAVRTVRSLGGNGSIVVVEDRGSAPFPAAVRVRTVTGEVVEYEIPVDHWLSGETQHEQQIPASVGRIIRVELDPSGSAPDVDRTNNFWPRG